MMQLTEQECQLLANDTAREINNTDEDLSIFRSFDLQYLEARAEEEEEEVHTAHSVPNAHQHLLPRSYHHALALSS